jgi:Flp pilus assembly protein TadD
MQGDLTNAVQHHLNGHLDQAAQIYQAILADDPRHADALHLLGVLTYQQGNHQQACELIERAITIQPRVAAYYSNLAEVYRSAGQLDKALASSRSALALEPDSPEAANNLGLTLLAQGDAAAAIPLFHAALRVQASR